MIISPAWHNFPNSLNSNGNPSHSSSITFRVKVRFPHVDEHELHFVLTLFSPFFAHPCNVCKKRLLCLQPWHRREQVVRRALSSWFEIARHKSPSHEFTTVVVLLHSVDPLHRGRSLACFRRRFLPRTKLEHPKRLDHVVHLPLPTLSDMLRIQVASLCLKLCLSCSFPQPPPRSLRHFHCLQCLLFLNIHSFPSSTACFPPSSSASRLRVVDLLDVQHLPSSGCPPWIQCPLGNCLFSLRRHCCLNLMPVLFCCCCCSNSMLAHPMTFLGLNFVSFPSRLFCPDIPSRAFPLLPPSQCLSTPLQSALDSSLCALVSPSP